MDLGFKPDAAPNTARMAVHWAAGLQWPQHLAEDPSACGQEDLLWLSIQVHLKILFLKLKFHSFVK